MSIIVLNDLVFKSTAEGKEINNEICFFYLFLNFASFMCCSTYLYMLKIVFTLKFLIIKIIAIV